MWVVILFLTLTVFLIYYTRWLLFYLNGAKLMKRYPAPPVWPILGNVLEFRQTSELLNKLQFLHEKYDTKVLRLNLGPYNALSIIDYKFLEFLLSSTKLITKSDNYKFLAPWLGTGLLTSTGDKWRTHRKIITPSFHFKILEPFVEVFQTQSDIMVKKLRKEVGKGSTDIYPYITMCALDIICETAMGTSVNAQEETHSPYVQSVKNMCRIVVERSTTAFMNYDSVYRWSNNYKTQVKALEILHGYTNSVIQMRRKELEAKNLDQLESLTDETGVKRRVAFLDMLLLAKIDDKPLNDVEIREEVDTFMFEGHDTTASAMSFALFSLANNPEVQQKAFDEIKDIFQDDRDRPATYKDLQEMKYLEMVIKETLRLYPSVPMYLRQVNEDVKFEDVTIPSNTVMCIFAFGMHRDPNFFPNPEVFDPERYTPENNQGKLPYAFIPFSAGPRNCIGQKFALLEMKSTISTVLRNFKLKPVVPAHKLQLRAETVLKSSNGMLVKIEERNWS